MLSALAEPTVASWSRLSCSHALISHSSISVPQPIQADSFDRRPSSCLVLNTSHQKPQELKPPFLATYLQVAGTLCELGCLPQLILLNTSPATSSLSQVPALVQHLPLSCHLYQVQVPCASCPSQGFASSLTSQRSQGYTRCLQICNGLRSSFLLCPNKCLTLPPRADPP